MAPARKPRKMVVIAIALATIVLLKYKARRRKALVKRRGAYPRVRVNWDQHMGGFFTRRHFIRYYKLSPQQFQTIVGKLKGTCEVTSIRHKKTQYLPKFSCQ